MTGSGKTTVGQASTRITGWTCWDHDELVERATGRPTPEVLVVDVDEETSDGWRTGSPRDGSPES
jgi:shikimate kinase